MHEKWTMHEKRTMDWSTPGTRRPRWLVAGAVAGAVAVGGAGFAWGAVPSAGTGVISACYAPAASPSGRLRVIDADAGQACTAAEVPLSWHQAGVRFRGAWSATAAYRVNDVVTRQGSSYVAVLGGTGFPVSDAKYWSVLARRGDPGEQGAQGPKGLRGAPGPAGPPGVVGVHQASAPTVIPEAVGVWTFLASSTVPLAAGERAVVTGTTGIGRAVGTGGVVFSLATCARTAGTEPMGWVADPVNHPVFEGQHAQLTALGTFTAPAAATYQVGVCAMVGLLTGWVTVLATAQVQVVVTA